jgi:UDP-2,4-diacetamido-2,4,6-trideoxy-beta-L-altropyranose hydrolase
METSVLIRVDSSFRIGTGHISRCLRLAEELEQKGVRVVFMCANLPGNISSSISELGFEIELFDSPAEEGDMECIEDLWPTGLQIFDASRTSNKASESNAEVVIVDHYALSELWERKLTSGGFRVIALDDLPGKPHSSDLVIRPGVSISAEDARGSGLESRELSGPRYAMVPREFCEAKDFNKGLEGSGASRVLVYFGGVDQSNASEQVVDSIMGAQIPDCSIELVLGSRNPNLEALIKKYKASPEVTIHSSLRSLAEVIGNCDAAVGAGGVSAFERAAAGLPSVLFSLSDNQIAVCKDLARHGMAQYFGSFDSFSSEAFISQFSHFMRELPTLRKNPDSPEYIDCLGLKRIAELVHPSSQDNFLIRIARPADVCTYFGWVNEPSVRRNSLNSESIDFDEHKRWFTQSLGDANVVMLVFELDSLPIAQVRFEVSDNCWRLNYSLDEIVRGRGWAKLIVGQAVSWLRSHRDSRKIDAVVKASNSASATALIAAGFVSQDQEIGSEFLRLYLHDA